MKRILLISPDFFNYPLIIVNELKGMGYIVDWINDRPSNSNIIKAILRINRDCISIINHKYFDRILKRIIDKDYDIFILIIGQSMWFHKNMIEELRKRMRGTKFIAYLWDSIKNCKYVTPEFLSSFDKRYSFDRSDANRYNEIEFLPLFYSSAYEEISKENSFIEYDLFYVGTAHPKKYKYINIMSKQLKVIYEKQFIYHYMPSKLKYLYHKVRDEEFSYAKLSDFKNEKLNEETIVKIIKKSRCILDSPQDGQEGLTIRTIECLGAKKKLITTNSDIKNYDFYKEENIYVYEGEFDFKSKFFTYPYCEIEERIYEKYSLKNWLKTILKK